MGKINTTYVIIGGLLAGLILNIAELIIGLYTGVQWEQIMAQLEIPELGGGATIGVLIINFAYGIALIWIYAAIRPRFGPGVGTAVIAGLAVWILAWLLVGGSFIVLGLFPTNLMLIEIVAAFIKVLIAAIAGAWIYKESAAHSPA